jgi:hypothetical protein
MPDIEMDFQTFVAPAYELRRSDELPSRAKFKFPPRLPELRYVVPVGKSKLVRPKRRAMDMAVALLLKSQLPGWAVDPTKKTADGRFVTYKKGPLTREQITALERNVLSIAKHTGLLGNSLTDEKSIKWAERSYETVSEWFDLALDIQLIFTGRPDEYRLPLCRLDVYLFNRSDGSRSMAVRPTTTREALMYQAAQMIAKGTVSRTCEYCGNTFLSGGQGREKEKKRGGSRFCSDKCRYSYHNEANRKLRG